MLLATFGIMAPAATATKPAIRAYSICRLQFLRTRSVAELSEAVRSGFDVRWVTLEEAIRTARTARELAVEQYESHRSAHELKVIGAGSGTLE
jgi:hypothetical protein